MKKSEKISKSLFDLDKKLQELDKVIIDVRSSLNDLVWDLIEKQQKAREKLTKT